jgi:hypothetical protein
MTLAKKNRIDPMEVEDEKMDEESELPIKQKISMYLDLKFGIEPLSIFDRWNFGDMMNESRYWELRKKCLFVYVMANDCPYRRLHAKIGCVENLSKRILQYNAIVAGAPQGTRKAAGHWKLVFWMSIPPIRNYSSKEITAEIDMRRGWKSKCCRGIEIGTEMSLDWQVTREVENKDSQYYSSKVCRLAIEKSTRPKTETFF